MQGGGQTDVIVMDLSKAFDKVLHNSLLYKLFKCGTDDITLKWLKSFLEKRRQSVVLEVDFQKSPLSDFIWRGTKGFSFLIGANFTDPKTGRCAWTNPSSSQGPLGIKLSPTSTKHIET